MTSFNREEISEPEVSIFEEIDRTPLAMSPEEKYELAVCLTRIVRSGMSWPKIETLSLSQDDLKRLKKMRAKAHRSMCQWLACRDLAYLITRLGGSVETGKLKLAISNIDANLKVIHG